MKNEQIEGEKEQVWEVGDFVYENWEGCPDSNTAYKITNVEDDKVFYNRTTDSWGKKNVLKLVKSIDLFSKTTTECQSGDLEEWQPEIENEFSPKWGEEVEVSDDGVDWVNKVFVAMNPIDNHQKYIVTSQAGRVSKSYKYCRKPAKTFTTEQAKQDLAKLHNLNVNQIKIVE